MEAVIAPSMVSLTELQPPEPADGRKLWEIVSLEYGASTDWDLKLLLDDGHRKIGVTIENAISFRAQDEGDMLDYWSARSAEDVKVGSFYAIGMSSYLAEMQSAGVAGLTSHLMHFLVAGNNLCVEAITSGPPRLKLE